MTQSPAKEYLNRCRGLVDTVESQLEPIRIASDWFAEAIAKGRLVHLFGAGHSRIMVEEMWPRYGSFPGFHPIVELSLTFHNQVSGANGQRQAMFLENQTGLAARILRNFDLSSEDCAMVISSGGVNIVPVEMAESFQRAGIKVVALVSLAHCHASNSKRKDGKKLIDFADVVLDNGAPVGDAMVELDQLDTPVSPGSTVGGCMVVNAVKSEVAARLVKAGVTPRVLTAANRVGSERADALFESAYDEHARRVAQLSVRLGSDQNAPRSDG